MTMPTKVRPIRRSCIGVSPLWGSFELFHSLIMIPLHKLLNSTSIGYADPWGNWFSPKGVIALKLGQFKWFCSRKTPLEGQFILQRRARRIIRVDSIAARRRCSAVLIHLVVSIAKSATIVFNRRRRYARIAESRVTRRIGSYAAGDIMPSSLDTVMEALTRDLVPAGRWRRRVIRNGAGMRTSSQHKRQGDRR